MTSKVNPSELNVCPSRTEIERFAWGESQDEDALRVSVHLDQCRVCEDTLDAINLNSETILEVLGNLERAPEYLDEPELDAGLQRLQDRTLLVGNETTRFANRPQVIAKDVRLDRVAEFGSYRLISKLGQGGMGAVYKAVHTQLDKTVAIKVLSANRFGDVVSTNRFKREMKALGRVQHPNVVVAYDGGQCKHEHFLVMEYVDGVDVAALDRRHKGLPTQVACEIIRQAAIGLQHAHEKGLIHRDIKPSNLMLDQHGVVKILDLGLARIEDELLSASGESPAIDDRTDLTMSGTAMGTIGFMSPEQALDSRNTNHSSDLYSLGATLYKLLAGRLPFPFDKYDTTGKMLVAIATNQPPSLADSRSDLPSELIQLVDRMLSKEPSERLSSARDFADQLAPFAGVSLAGLAATPAGKLPKFVSDVHHDIQSSPSPTRAKPRPWGWIATSAGIMAALLLAAQTFWIRTEYGTLQVEIVDEQVQAALKSNGISVIDQANHKVWEIRAQSADTKQLPKGEYRFDAPGGLVITDENGLEINANEMKLVDANQNLRIRVRVSPTENFGGVDKSNESVPSADPNQREWNAAKWIQSVGGKILEFPGGKTMEPDSIRHAPGSLRCVELSDLGEIKKVSEMLSNLPNLQTFFANNTPLDPDDLNQILTNRKLDWLQLRNTGLTSKDFRQLRALPRLNSLAIHQNQVDDDWEFLNELPWLPEIDLITNDPSTLVKLCRFSQLDTVWLTVDFRNSPTSENDFKRIAAQAVEQNPTLRMGINARLVSPDPVLETAKQLANEGWEFSGVYSNWSDPWNSKQIDAWNTNDTKWFHVRSIKAPDKLSLTSELLEALPSLGHSFDTLRFHGATNVERLPAFLRRRVLTHLDLAGSDLNDAALLKLAEVSGIKELTAVNTRVTESGIKAFRTARPDCNVIAGMSTFDEALPNSRILEAYEKMEVASDTPSEYELKFSLQRESGNEGALLVNLPVMDQRAVVVLSGYGKTCSGLELIDKAKSVNNETTTNFDPFIDGHVHHVVIRVTQQSIFAAVDGKTLVDWPGDINRLSTAFPATKTGLHIHCGQETRFQISDLSFQDLTQDADAAFDRSDVTK